MIVANWKSNKTLVEAKQWLGVYKQQVEENKKTVVICPPFTLLSAFSQELPLEQIGAQTVSSFGMGAYTGEINTAQIAEFAAYVIIGHSERREYCREDDALLAEKVKVATQAGLTPIFCVQGNETPVPQGVKIVAYEPIWAIGSGKAETPEHAEEVAAEIMKKNNVEVVLYGGSVSADNVHSFTQMEHIGGVLVGGASLDPHTFSQIIAHA